jgi:PAS domain S-box-containing protein
MEAQKSVFSIGDSNQSGVESTKSQALLYGVAISMLTVILSSLVVIASFEYWQQVFVPNNSIYIWCVIILLLMSFNYVLYHDRRVRKHLEYSIEQKGYSSLLAERASVIAQNSNAILIEWKKKYNSEGKYPSFELQYVSPNIEELWEITPIELRDNYLLLDGHPDDKENIIRPAMEDAVKHKKSRFVIEYRIFHPKTKSVMWVEDRVFISYNDIGRDYLWQSVMTDITELKEKRNLEERASVIAQNSDVIMLEYEISYDNLDDRIGKRALTYISPNVERLWGEEVQNLFDKPNIYNCHPEDLSGILEKIQTAVDDRISSLLLEYRVVRPDESIFWVEDRLTITYDSLGRQVRWQNLITDVTYRVEQERILKESQALLKEAEEISRTGSWEYNPYTGKCYWSDVVYAIYGRDKSLGEPTTKEFFKLHCINSASEFKQIISNVIQYSKNGKTYEREFYFRNTEGNDIYTLVSMIAVFDKSGEFVSLRGTTRDITKRKLAEEEIKRLSNVIENSKSIHIRYERVIGTDHWLVGHISASCRNLGYEPDELKDYINSGASIIHPEDRVKIRELSDLNKANEIYNYVTEFRVLTKDGNAIWVQAEMISAVHGNRNDVEYCDAILTDINAQKDAERKANRAELIIGNSKSVLHYFKVVNNHFQLDYASSNISQFGYSFDELAYYLANDIHLIHPDDLPRVREITRAALANKVQSTEIEYRFRKSDGSYVWIDEHANIIRDSNGKLVGIETIMNDITEKKKSNEELLRLNNVINQSSSVYIRYEQHNKSHYWDLRYVSQNSELVLGYDAKELIELLSSGGTIVHPDDYIRVGQMVQQYGDNNETSFKVEYRIVTKQGEVRWVQQEFMIHPVTKEQDYAVADCLLTDITTIKNAEISARRAELIVEQSKSVLMHYSVANDNQIILDYCSTNISQFGYTVQGIKDVIESSNTIVHPDYVDNCIYQLHNARINLLPRFDVQYPLCKADGNYVWVEESVYLFYAEDGTLNTIQAVLTDIDERKKTAEKAERAELIIEQSKSILFFYKVNEDGHLSLEYASSNLEQLGYTADELDILQTDRVTLVHPEDYERVVEVAQEAIQGKVQSFQCEYRFKKSSGEYIWVEEQSNFQYNSAGKWISTQVILTDITDRKIAEEDSRRAELIIEHSNSVLARYEYNTEGYFELDYVSNNVSIIGYTFEQLRDLILNGTWLIHEEDTEQVKKVMSQTLSLKSPTYTMEYRLLQPNNVYIWVEDSGSIRYNKDGKSVSIQTILTNITERKKAEENARLAELIIERSNSVLCYSSHLNGRFELKYVSSNVSQFGYTLESFREAMKNGDSHIHPDDRARCLERAISFLSDDSSNLTTEYRILQADGRSVWVEDHTMKITDPHGKLTAIQSIVTDISKRKEEEIRLNQARLIIEKSNSVVARWNYAGQEAVKLEYISQNIERWGYNAEEFKRNPVNVYHPDDIDNVRAISRYNREIGNNSYSYEYRLLLPTGGYTWVEEFIYIEREPNGQIIAYNSITNSIEERKQSELRSNRMNMIVENNDSVLMEWECIYNKHGKISRVIRYVSHNCERLWGYKASELIDGGSSKIIVHPDDRGRIIPELTSMLEQKKERFILEYRIPTKDGNWTWVEDRLFVTYDEHGRERFWQNILTDINERVISKERLEEKARELEESNIKLEQARQLAESANKAKSAFLSSMSHELRTPLNAIIGFTQVLRKDEQLRREQKKYINIMYNSGTHLLKMINDILDISKIESGRMEILEQATNIPSVITEACEMIEAKCIEKGLSFGVAIDDSVPELVMLDDVRLRQILLNILSNAVKFTSIGGVEISATCKTIAYSFDSKQRVNCSFRIADTGRGIPSEQITNIFEPFKQVNGMYSEGTGLGLAISNKLVNMMGGDIQVESTLGEGTVFTITIPCEVCNSISMINSIQPVKEISSVKNSPKVLIVDDIESNRIVAESILRPYNFEIITTNGGAETIEYLEHAYKTNTLPALVLCDLLMPDVDGYQVLKYVRGHHTIANLPMIAVTANGFEDARDEAISAGFDSYVRKPYTIENILLAIDDLGVVEFEYHSSSDVSDDTNSLIAGNEQYTIRKVAECISVLPEQIRNELISAIEVQDTDTVLSLLQSLEYLTLHQQEALRPLIVACGDGDYRFVVELTELLLNV